MDLERKESIRMVLNNPELLERILQYHSDCKKTLLSASLTAKSFSEPALNVLWYEINSIWPLFRILPTFQRGVNSRGYLFTGPIRNEHLQRVLYYAKRIRFFDYQTVNDLSYITAPVDLVISTFMRLDKLGAFVPLRKIRLSGYFLRHTMVFPLTAPYLEKVVIRINRPQDEPTEIAIASSLQSVAQSPLLRSLTIEGPFRDSTLQVIPDFINLHNLSMGFASHDVPVHLLKQLACSVPSLRRLRIQISLPNGPRIFGEPDDSDDRLSKLENRSSFPLLEVLDAKGTPNHLENLFSILDAPLLKSISLSLYLLTPDVGGHIHKVVEMNRQLLKDKVHSLSIHAATPSLSFVGSFEKLQQLRVISAPGTISMPDMMATFRSGALWSPSLIRLHLKQMNPANGLSVTALYYIADACPNLKLLEISIHFPEKPAVQKGVPERKPHDLQKLVFINLPDGWVESMALAIDFVSLLDHLFPSMVVPDYTGLIIDKPGALATRQLWWKGVQDMWKMCQTSKERKK